MTTRYTQDNATWLRYGEPPMGLPTEPGTYQPDATNTGTSGTLTPMSNDQTITVDGTVIENRDLTGKIAVKAANVTIRNCRIRGAGPPTGTSNWGLISAYYPETVGLVVEDCHLEPDTPVVGWTGIIGHDYTIRRSNITRTVDGAGVYNTANPNGPANVTIEACYIHDLSYIEPDPNQPDNRTHNDGIQIQGNSAISIVGNTITANVADGIPSDGVSPYYPSVTGQGIGITPGVGVTSDCTIDRNWIDYGAQSITVAEQGSETTARITGNRFGRNQPAKTINADNPYDPGGNARRPLIAGRNLSMPGLPTYSGPDTAGNVYDDDDTPVTVTRSNNY